MDKPVKFVREDGMLKGVFIVEEKRDVNETDAKNYYYGLLEKKNNIELELTSLEEKLEEYEKEIALFGSVFEEAVQESESEKSEE